MRIRLKRVYDDSSSNDGVRLLVDRYWPPGLTKATVNVHEWLLDLAPSRQLLRWFRSHPGQLHEFENRYEIEISDQRILVDRVRDLAANGPVTLVYASKGSAAAAARILARYIVPPSESLQDREVQIRYLRQLRRQSRYAGFAFSQLEGVHNDAVLVQNALAGVTPGAELADKYDPRYLVDMADEFIYMNIQNLLVAAANVSKMLHGGSRMAPDRPPMLRDLLGLISESRHLKDRTLRNFFEHFDERLDSWAVHAPSPDIDVDDYEVHLSPGSQLGLPKVKVIAGGDTFDLAGLALAMRGVEIMVNSKLRDLLDPAVWVAEGIDL